MERVNEQLNALSASLIVAGPLSNGRSMTRNPLVYSFMYFKARKAKREKDGGQLHSPPRVLPSGQKRAKDILGVGCVVVLATHLHNSIFDQRRS